MKEEKQELRKVIATRKKGYTLSQRKELSADILKNLETDSRFIEANTILMYYSLPDEVQTHDFVEKWRGKKNILLPVVVGDDLELRTYTGKQELSEGAFHIDEPTGETFTDYDAIDLVIVPGVAFDNNGNRLGRGKGYYDRLLPRIGAYKIGICFPFQLVKEIPTEPFDKKMDKIISL